MVVEMSVNVYYYLRVSSESQKDNYSFEVQRSSLDSYCKKNGFTCEREFLEIGSGENEERKELLKMLSSVEVSLKSKNPITDIVVYCVDRLHRNHLSKGKIDLMLRKGLRVHYIEDELVYHKGSSSSVKDCVNQMTSQGERYNGQLKERVTAATGKRFWSGENLQRPMFGYKKNYEDNKALMVVEDEAQIVRLIFDMYSTGKYSQAAIACELNKKGCKTKKKSDFRDTTISYILSNETYIGMSKRKGEKVRALTKPIITDHQFLLVQSLKDPKNTRVKCKTYRKFVLGGILKGECGYALSGEFKKNKRYTLYGCAGCPAPCDLLRKTTNEKKLFEFIEKRLNNIKLDSRIEEFIVAINKMRVDRKLGTLRGLIIGCKKRISEQQTKKNNLIGLLAEDVIDREEYKETLVGVKGIIKNVSNELSELEGEYSRREGEVDIKEYASRFKSHKFKLLPDKKTQKILDILFSKITWNKYTEKMEIYHKDYFGGYKLV